MNVEERIRELSVVTGQPLVCHDDGCDVIVNGRAILLAYRADESVWQVVGVLMTLPEAGDAQRMRILEACLEMNFRTHRADGLRLGKVGETILAMKRIAENDDLTSEAFAQLLVDFATAITALLDGGLGVLTAENFLAENVSSDANRFASFIRV